MAIRIAINGYGNLGRGVEAAVNQSADLELVAVFTRRDPKTVKISSPVPVVPVAEMSQWQDKIDVCVLCGGSASDLETQGPEAARLFNTVDSFDTHARIPEYFAILDKAAKESGHLSLLSTGWDPGLFSLQRVLADSILPNGKTYTFWGRGVSQGHGDAIRRVPGVKNAVQYTIPITESVTAVKNGTAEELTPRQMHRRECYVVLEDGADPELVREKIVTMENYFADYDTTVNFISAAELARDHAKMPHGGHVIRTGVTGENEKQVFGFELNLDSNPGFTGAVLTACARAVAKLAAAGQRGAITIFDLPAAALSSKPREKLIQQLL